MTDSIPLCLFSIQACFYCIGSVSVITVKLKNENTATQMFSRWYYMVEQTLTVLFCVHSSIRFDKIHNLSGGKQPQTVTEPPVCFTDDCR